MEWYELLLWGGIVTVAMCWMVLLAYMAYGPKSRREDTGSKTEAGVDEPVDDTSEND